MADYIDREELLKEKFSIGLSFYEELDGVKPKYAVLEKDILNAPSVDAVKVVRCKDCKHRTLKKGQGYWCNRLSMFASNGDFFCRWGEKKNEH